uniref:NADH-ubiquinone oxidoreductase chain 6 n=1 Tax=Tylosurus melanotus TaxID=3053213 RepID=A0A167NFE3_9TELE|nr:NADH dehydrogenase subunit 6 [Tylosurus acus melanotus]
MSGVMDFFLLMSVMGLLAVPSNPSPDFAALGLVLEAGVGCGIYGSYGDSFFTLIILLMYMRGTWIVFACETAIAADRDPNASGLWAVFGRKPVYMIWLFISQFIFCGGWYDECAQSLDEFDEVYLFRGEFGAVGLMYCSGGGFCMLGACTLQLSFFVVVELTRAVSRRALRPV